MSEETARAGRPPANLRETLTANSRPQPAIPAVIVFLLTIMTPIFSLEPGVTPDHANASLVWLLVPLGILSSCALAIAAGFCSVFPQAFWIVLAAWALKFTEPGGPLPPYNRWVFMIGMLACAAMFVAQVYRIRNGQFVPTIIDPPQDEADY